MEESQPVKKPHVLIFPLPAQGHINTILGLARLLCLANIRVTFVNSEHNHQRLLDRCGGDMTRLSYEHGWPGFRFASISDGLPPDNPQGMEQIFEFATSLKTKALFKEMVVQYREAGDPVTCIIGDGLMTFTIDVGDELGIPVFCFRTGGACSFWACFCIPRLIEAGELPFGDDADMDHPIGSVPGMETILRRRDLPSFCRAKQLTDPVLQFAAAATVHSAAASALIVNTFEDLEGPVLSRIRDHFPTVYTIGPLHSHLESRLADSSYQHSNATPVGSCSSSLWKEDRSCMEWLDSQPPKSVLYVSFGSLTVVTPSQLLDFWHGLVNSQSPFLWVVRPDLVNGTGEVEVPEELLEQTRKTGFLVEWAPQQEVLVHPAVGGFLTHSGWNSTLESIVAGVPMICWPFFADQQINSRYVGHVWGIGLDIKDVCDKGTVERMVRELMHGNVELRKSAAKMADLARKSVACGGSSHTNLDRLIEAIRATSNSL